MFSRSRNVFIIWTHLYSSLVSRIIHFQLNCNSVNNSNIWNVNLNITRHKDSIITLTSNEIAGINIPLQAKRSIQLMTGLMSLQIESSNSALIQLFQNWWLQNCVLAAQDRLIGAYLHRAVYELRYGNGAVVSQSQLVGRFLKVSNSLYCSL